MAQVSPQYCPQCGTEVVPQQKFCATCGLPWTLQNVEQVGPSSPGVPVPVGGLQPPVSQAQHFAMPGPVAPAHKRKIGRNGIILLLLALLLVIIAASYGVLRALGVGKPTQASISRTSINTTVTYASVDMTILNVQQSQNFLDDPVSTSDGMLRVQIQARNTFKQPATLTYSNIAHLIQPGGKVGAVIYASSNPTIAPGATQTSNVDFALPLNIKPAQLSLQLGTTNEEQLNIPLNGHADVSKYAPKTIKITKSLTYLNMDWTLVEASSQLSFNGQQASKGMRYVTVTLNVNNPLMETVIAGSPYTYMHLKTSTTEVAPVSASMPISVDPGVSSKTGMVTFQIPQEGSVLTLTLSTQGNSGFDPATATFQI